MDLTLGGRFKSFSSLTQAVKEYKKNCLNEYYIRDCRTIDSQKKRSPDTVRHLNTAEAEILKYYQIRYSCIHGGRPYKSINRISSRKTTTFKSGCKAGFFLKLCGNNLEVKELIEEHSHETSLAIFRALHHQRLKLPENIKKDVQNCLSKGGNKKLIQHDIIEKTGCNITLKDLTNLNRKIRNEKPFEDCIQMLQTAYACNVEVLLEEKVNTLRAFYFQDKKMEECYSAFPEMLFMDGTYCLMDNRAACYILLIEDSNGNSEVVAVGFILEENLENINWFVETFKSHNKQWRKTVVIMTDKDAKERDVLKKNFPTAQLNICFFHVMQIFKREISRNMGINAEEIALSRNFLRKIAYSKSPSHYDEIYKELKANVPECVLNYYNKNWHPIKEQWVMGYTFRTHCFLNKTNNRLECVNSKLKSVIKRYSSMEECLQNLFVVINSMRLETDAKSAKIMHKIRTSSLASMVHQQYEKLLTPYAYTYVENSINKAYKEENFTNIGDNTFLFKKSDILLRVTPISCECLFWSSMGLPCGHIFYCRKILNLNLYDESICLERWKTSYYRLHQRLYHLQDENLNEAYPPHIEINTTCSKVKKHLTSHQKFTMMQSECLKLSQLVGEVGEKIFTHRYQAIKYIVNAWSKGEEIFVSTKKGFEEISQLTQENIKVSGSNVVHHEDHNYYSLHSSFNNSGLEDIPVIFQDQGVDVLSNNISLLPNHNMTNTISIFEPDITIDIDDSNVKQEYISISDVGLDTDLSIAADVEVDSTSIELSQVVIPPKLKKRGRPKGLGVTVVGLPRKRSK